MLQRSIPRRLWVQQMARWGAAGCAILAALTPAPAAEPLKATVYVIEQDGQGARAIFSDPHFVNLGSPAVSPDGRRIAMDGWHAGGGVSDARILVVNFDGAGFKDLGDGAMPTWSPDGDWFAVSRYAPNQGVWLKEVQGPAQEVFDPQGWGIQWSPDGTRIGYVLGNNVIVENLAEGNRRPLWNGKSPYQMVYWNMCWSPDNSSLCLVGVPMRNGAAKLLVVHKVDDPDPQNGRIICDDPSLFADAAWHPDGKRLVFSRRDVERNHMQIYEVDLTTMSEPRLFPGQPADRDNLAASWTPDGRQLVFISRSR